MAEPAIRVFANTAELVADLADHIAASAARV